MPTRPTDPRDQRRHRILQLLEREQIRNQDELRQRLAADGVDATQATLSRDLRDLGVVKGSGGYELPNRPAVGDGAQQGLWQAVRTWLLGATPAQHLVVLRTPPGGAPALGLALDKAGLTDVLGTIAGDDTVLVVLPNAAKARAFCRRLRSGTATGAAATDARRDAP
ncbi:MAG: arginine repressor [Planctomycetes bacterium]|nr:arginine repressor [Planctomycetota bacterium]